jgi:hypothetical protein
MLPGARKPATFFAVPLIFANRRPRGETAVVTLLMPGTAH